MSTLFASFIQWSLLKSLIFKKSLCIITIKATLTVHWVFTAVMVLLILFVTPKPNLKITKFQMRSFYKILIYLELKFYQSGLKSKSR